MNSKERRERILNKLLASKDPKKGQELGEEMGVTRQVIVKDIAILRAEGNNIIATPDGYIIASAQSNKIKRIIAVSHNELQMEDELRTIVKYGAMVEDVIVEHPLYGEMRGMLMIKTLKDVENFVERFDKGKAQPLSRLTDGVHMHTVVADSQEVIDNLLKELAEKGYLACD
ncbi:MAG: transcription repressor NadR [Clostridiales bacterium]|uniref:transcription repressor NadR n=1 Tax=Clostridium sp. N3C TaxID=1776758 RepID=UPI00092E01BF|nr:transcription repressor NadR [Clostridium sp. N3C]NLZ47484.1 transcription repressor NadR [Clostridiales bacterium]SCN26304.1 putative transcription repressor NiaR [Clostridium sp. N3C]